MLDWDKCKEDFIRTVEKDEYRVNAIILWARQRQKFIESQKVNEDTVSFIVEGYYEVIKELLVAYMLRDGMRSKNHKCLITYFYMNNPDYEGYAKIISKMSYYRNRLGYYGEGIPLSFYEKIEDKIHAIIELLYSLL